MTENGYRNATGHWIPCCCDPAVCVECYSCITLAPRFPLEITLASVFVVLAVIIFALCFGRMVARNKKSTDAKKNQIHDFDELSRLRKRARMAWAEN